MGVLTKLVEDYVSAKIEYHDRRAESIKSERTKDAGVCVEEARAVLVSRIEKLEGAMPVALAALERLSANYAWKPYAVGSDEIDDGWRSAEHQGLEALRTLKEASK